MKNKYLKSLCYIVFCFLAHLLVGAIIHYSIAKQGLLFNYNDALSMVSAIIGLGLWMSLGYIYKWKVVSISSKGQFILFLVLLYAVTLIPIILFNSSFNHPIISSLYSNWRTVFTINYGIVSDLNIWYSIKELIGVIIVDEDIFNYFNSLVSVTAFSIGYWLNRHFTSKIRDTRQLDVK